MTLEVSEAVAMNLADRIALLPFFAGMPREALDSLSRDIVWFSLRGGTTLFNEGEKGESFYVVLSGRLGVITGAAERDSSLIAEIGPGETVGEMALVSGEARSATVIALRDSELIGLHKDAFDRLADRWPGFMRAITRLLVRRLRETSHRAVAQDAPRTLALLPLSAAIPIESCAQGLAGALRDLGRKVTTVNSRDLKRGAEYFSAAEADSDFLIYQGECDDTEWTRLSIRQSDRIVLIGDRIDGVNPALDPLVGARHPGTLDLVVFHRNGAGPGAAPLLHRYQPDFHCHVRAGHREDLARLARQTARCAIGIALSGGGARGFSHIGVLRALGEAKIPIDIFAGASMGSVVAAAGALEWEHEELCHRLKRAFLDTNPVSDYMIPIVALSRGRKVSRLLREHFGEVEIEDMWRPFFCTSSDLTVGDVRVHRSGRLWKSLRASTAIPGVLMPVAEGNHILVDGGVLNNLPIDQVLAMRRGPVIAVDVMKQHRLHASAKHIEEISLWDLLRPRRRGVPNILSLLMRSGTLGSELQVRHLRPRVDLLIEPQLESVGMLDFAAADRVIEAGYRHAIEVLEKSSRLSYGKPRDRRD
jgi:NTE family protein